MIVLKRDSRPGSRGQEESALQVNRDSAKPRVWQRGSRYEKQSPVFHIRNSAIRSFDSGIPLSRMVARTDKSRVRREKDPVVNEFQKAWLLSGNGFDKTEALVLLYRMRDGSISARSLGRSGQYRRFTFAWTSTIIAVVHTHPNGDDPRPLGEDLRSADKLGIPVFTITLRGMYVYDPDSKKISMVHAGLDWLDSTKWLKDRQAVAQRR